MYLIQLLLPLYTNDGHKIDNDTFQTTRRELVDRCGGLTAYNQAPVDGLWKDEPGHTTHDELIIFEVMCDELDRKWWSDYRHTLEARFGQEELVIRAATIERL